MNEQLKSYKTVEQIARKHRMDVSDIQKQLDMGAPIEHEHTNNQKLAVEIALQHLDEIPDYYTRLKKMEASAKKEHKKFKDVKEEKKTLRNTNPCWKGYTDIGTKIKKGRKVPNCVPVNSESTDALNYDWDTPVRERADRYCPKCEKLERRTECKYGTKYWDMFSVPAEVIGSKKEYNITMPHPGNFPESYDHEHSMARSEISTIISAAKRLRKKMKGEGNIEAWVQSKITKAADYLDTAADYVDSGEMQKEQLSFEVGHTSKDTRNTIRQYNIRKLASQGSTEGERTAARGKISGIQLPLANSTDLKSFGQFVSEAKKSEMKCNSPKSEPVGDSLTGKSHVVKACENGKEKLLRFGQRGVKGSPKKKGESKEYASRRNRFQNRHAKNIAKGPMSAAYWANKVKW